MKMRTKLAVDVSGLLWPAFYAGVDKEHGIEVVYEGRTHKIPGVAHIYENVTNMLVGYCEKYGIAPRDVILVIEGVNAKAPRMAMYPGYKAGSSRPDEAYTAWRGARDKLVSVWRGLGATAVVQDGAEADDVMAWLAQYTRGDLILASRDHDLLKLAGVNAHGAKVLVSLDGYAENHNPYGYFPLNYITVYKALVGDESDKIKGIKGFGAKSWEAFDREFGDAGMAELERLAERGSLEELAAEALQHKGIAQIYEGGDQFLSSYRVAKLHPEWVNRIDNQLKWLPGFPNPNNVDALNDERLRKWAAKTMLVTADNFEAAKAHLAARLSVSPEYGIDFETSTPPESDDWLKQREAESKVDVIASVITGVSINYGSNGQNCMYISVNHADTNNVTMKQAAELIGMLEPEKVKIAHNAQGFEIPVAHINMSEFFKDNGWRGFIPNMVDSRIGASYWDENLMQYGLKVLSKKLFDYEQVSYDEVTQGRKMDEVPATDVVAYGCDDSFTAYGLWNFFSLFMSLEGTLDAFFEFEQKPMYTQAVGYLRGFPLDQRKLTELYNKDKADKEKYGRVLDSYLIEAGWEGTICPVATADNIVVPAFIKEVYKIITGDELKTAVRTPEKLYGMIAETGSQEGAILAALFIGKDLVGINRLLQRAFDGKPDFNIGSPKQKQALLYDTMKLPVRLRNRATDTMRKAGIREGNARTDDDAINLAIKMGDCDEMQAKTLKAMVELSSINTRTALYWEAYPYMVHWQTNRIHPSLRQSSTNTRRYSGADPNIQQQEGSYGGVRSVVLPHHRNAVICSLDEQAQEVRQLADYCQDPALLSCYVGSPDQLRDVHSIVGARIAGVTYEEFRKRYKIEEAERKLPDSEKTYPTLYVEIRQRAKITLFATIYGAMAPKIAEGLGISTEEAQTYIDAIYEMFPGVKAWKEESEELARTYGYVPIHGNTIRHLASLVSSADNYTAQKAMRQAGNARIQSAGGNQIKRVMSRIWDSDLFDKYDYVFYFSVHDETVHSIGVKDAPVVIPILHGFMVEQFLNVVPSASSIGIGKNYGELNEIGESPDVDKINKAIEELFNEKEKETA